MIVAIERGFAHSYLVVTEPRSALKKRFRARRDNIAFSEATGYATAFAAHRGMEMVDRTGRLSEGECAQLVDAYGIGG